MGDLIKTTPDLNAACARARETGVLAIDTEFVWMRTYRPQLGIVQIGADPENCWALDCMTGMDTLGLKVVVEDPTVVKILHDARQDLIHLHHYTGAEPKNVFDTQLAAAFAGFPGGIGLQKLLMEAIDVGLPKTETLTDWTQRPLSAAQVEYALDDVRYLPALREELLKRAGELGTIEFLKEELGKYNDEMLYEDYDPDEVWKRVKLRGVRLDGQGFAVLRAVASLREDMAKKWNLPRNWLGDDESLAEMASRKAVGRLRHRMRGSQADTIRGLYAAAIEVALDLPKEDWPENPKRHYIAEVVEAADKAHAWLAEKAASLHIDAGVIANRATITAYVDNIDDDSNPLANGWRYELVGQEMAELFGVE